MNKKGFTLIELLVSIAILAVLTLIALPAVSKTQNNADTKKFLTYEQALLNGAKLYVDSNKDDLWKRNETGCLKISYTKLKLANLIKDFNKKGIKCDEDSETFVFVTKSSNKYNYKTSLVCRKGSKIVYSNKQEASKCENIPDNTPPVIVVNPNTSDWISSVKLEEKLKVEIKDDSNLMANASFKYKWTTNINDTSSEGYQATTITDYKTNTKKEVSTKIKIPANINGVYYLKIIPISICDISSQCQNNVYDSGAYKITNKPTKPTINLHGYGSGSWTNQTVSITASSSSYIGIDHYEFSHDNIGWSNDMNNNPTGWNRTFNSDRSSMTVKIGWDGQWNFYIRAVDKNGNVSDSSDVFTIRIDKTPPHGMYAYQNCISKPNIQGCPDNTGNRCNSTMVHAAYDYGSGLGNVYFNHTYDNGQSGGQGLWLAGSSSLDTTSYKCFNYGWWSFNWSFTACDLLNNCSVISGRTNR